MARGSRRRGHDAGGENESNERWLLTYSDMITLLLALFVVLFSISSVNISKFQSLQVSLKEAFSGGILAGGQSILNGGIDSSAKHSPSNTEIPSIVPLTPTVPSPGDQGTSSSASQAQINALMKEAQEASQENSEFRALQRRLNDYAKAHGFANQVKAQIQQRGLVVTVLTDNLLFGSGSDTLEPASYPLLSEISHLINLDTEEHPVDVEGYTDDVPIDTTQFPSNWELSTGRATTVLQYLLSQGVPGGRLHASGYADHFPVASNATAEGRTRNRRVEIVFERKYPSPSPGA
ncbi:MAG: flagellar motor protein MotB [Solirubrobacteraceae bacterium]